MVCEYHPVASDLEDRTVTVENHRSPTHRRPPRQMAVSHHSATECHQEVSRYVDFLLDRQLRGYSLRFASVIQPMHQVQDVPAVVDENPTSGAGIDTPFRAAGVCGSKPRHRDVTQRAQAAFTYHFIGF